VELLTPHGKVVCLLEEGKEPVITAPECVTVTLR